MKVAYLGPRGSFSEEAATNYFLYENIEHCVCDSLLEVLEAVSEGQAEKGIVPIENSIEGTINVIADGLLQYKLHIEGDLIFPVSLHLLTVRGGDLDNIQEVWSILPALAQCRQYIKKIGVRSKQFDSTSLAAETLQLQQRQDVAAIASESAARVFDLKIAKRNIQDNLENHTRFIVVNNDNHIITDPHKTMLVVTPCDDYPGLLTNILNAFSSLSINLSWIESRPTKKKLGNYHFFLEAEAGISDPRIEKALAILHIYGHEVRVLGSYNTIKL
ncbi:prephenate dehydratase [Bacillus sp. 03113]|uniref:prephenate dehydratase n=1 Tax=Bacillus sp. 03113 TaxID=2578211 RepID=UPI0011417F9B|nr:prephenate dehydratase [Bacillus sp. 03113]